MYGASIELKWFAAIVREKSSKNEMNPSKN